ncbi:hypothetical protein E1301_Tti012073 [Triplophysa tibetana]|uniref:CUB domain-containing protein n=1 Tax=Triplophysa tibetana TaxID=1572043 RepID=A0A5A9PLW6_9TELE|nr:hypothetical protein E1301_Tti012073 [Triplophysa tibetana]
MVVRFKSDSNQTAKGFSAVYTVTTAMPVTILVNHQCHNYPNNEHIRSDNCPKRLAHELREAFNPYHSWLSQPAKAHSWHCQVSMHRSFPEAKHATQTGWGDKTGNKTTSKVAKALNQVALPVVPYDTCERMEYRWFQVKPSMMCCGFGHGGLKDLVGTEGFPSILVTNGAFCQWNIRVPTGKNVHLHFSNFSLEETTLCLHAKVTLSDNIGSLGWNIPCGCSSFSAVLSPVPTVAQLHREIWSAGDTLSFIFSSNEKVVDLGFGALWKGVDPNDIEFE